MPQVLVVEGDPLVRSVLTRLLQRDGYEFQAAGSGREALERIESANFDLIVTDVTIPDMDGMELVRAVRELGHSVPIVAVAGGGGRVDEEALLTIARELGEVEVVPQPFNLDHIRAVLARRLPLLVSVLALVG